MPRIAPAPTPISSLVELILFNALKVKLFGDTKSDLSATLISVDVVSLWIKAAPEYPAKDAEVASTFLVSFSVVVAVTLIVFAVKSPLIETFVLFALLSLR